MLKKIIQTKGFWPSVFILAAAFIILFNIVRVCFEFGFDFAGYFSLNFRPENILMFIGGNLIGGIFYGFIMAFYKYYRHYKDQD